MLKIKNLLAAFCLLAPVVTLSFNLKPGAAEANHMQQGFCWWQYDSEKESVAVMSSDATASRSGNTLTTSHSHAGNFGCSLQNLRTTHTWSAPPSQLVVGEEMTFEVGAAWELDGTSDCTSLTTGVHTSITAGVTTITAKRSNIPISKEPDGSVSNSGSWTVPAGSQVGDKLTLTAIGNTGIGGGSVTYTYVYNCMATPDKTAEAEKTAKPIPTDTPWPETVCGGYTRENTWGDSGARFSELSGEVTVAPCYDQEDAEPAEMGMTISRGSVIETEAESWARIVFADMTVFDMKSFTKVFIEPAPPRQTHLELLAGKLWVNVKKVIETGQMEVNTVQAIAGARGTTFIVETTGQETTLKVIEGTVAFTSRVTNESVDVQAGEAINASDAGLGEVSPFDVEAEMANWPEAQTETQSEVPIQAAAPTEAAALEEQPQPEGTDTAQPAQGLPVRVICIGGAVLACLGLLGMLLLGGVYFLVRKRRGGN